jgi:general secretion pathway protein A
MFLEFYGLREQPFGVTPDPRYLYFSATHREALASLFYGLESSRGFLTLIAPPGMGKTTLIFHLLERLRGTAHTAFLFQTQCDSRELFRYLLSDLGIDAGDQNLARMHEQLNEVLINDARAGKRFILVIDEAQNLEDSALETVRLLSDFETPQSKLMQIILIGQPQLADKLTRPSLAQLRQRISIVSRLEPFTPAETVMYIDHRLSVAGHSGDPLFTYDALALIAVQSGGIPRNINNLCFNALSLGFAKGQKKIDASTVREILSDLSLDLLGSLRDAARYVSPIPSPIAEANWKADLVGREVQAAARAAQELHAPGAGDKPAVDLPPGRANPRGSEKRPEARSQIARPATGRTEAMPGSEGLRVEDADSSVEEPSLPVVAAGAASNGDQTHQTKAATTNEESKNVENTARIAEEAQVVSQLLASSHSEAKGKEGDGARAAIHAESQSHISISAAAIPVHKKNAGSNGAGHKSGPDHRLAEKDSAKSQPYEKRVADSEQTPAAPPAARTSWLSFFRRSAGSKPRLFRRAALPYTLILLLGLVFIWPSRRMTPVRATPADQPDATQPAQDLPQTGVPQESKASDSGPLTVVVQPEQTLSGLSKNYIGTYDEKALEQIRALNPGIKNPDLILVGQRIQLPRGSQDTKEVHAQADTEHSDSH